MTFKEWLFASSNERLASYLIHEEKEDDWGEDSDGEMMYIGSTPFYITTDGMSFRSETDAIEHQVAILVSPVPNEINPKWRILR